MCWLEASDYHLITADNPLYPSRLRAIDWFPSALLVIGQPQVALLAD